MMLRKVDLPEPDGPMSATNSPRSTDKVTPRSARNSTSSVRYTLVTRSTSIKLEGSPDMALLLDPSWTRRLGGPRRRSSRQTHADDHGLAFFKLALLDFGEVAVGNASLHWHGSNFGIRGGDVDQRPVAGRRLARAPRRLEEPFRWPESQSG